MVKEMLIVAGGAALAAIAPMSAAAAAGPAASQGFYASQAISSGQYAKAEEILKPVSYADAKDPARLINLATVYAQTNRLDEARSVLARVEALPDESLILKGGASYSSHRIASAMLKTIAGTN